MMAICALTYSNMRIKFLARTKPGRHRGQLERRRSLAPGRGIRLLVWGVAVIMRSCWRCGISETSIQQKAAMKPAAAQDGSTQLI